MRCLTRCDAGRLWILIAVLLALLMMPTSSHSAGSMLPPQIGTEGHGGPYLGGPPGPDGESGDPDDWGIDACHGTTKSDRSVGIENSSQSKAGSHSEATSWEVLWMSIVYRVFYLGR